MEDHKSKYPQFHEFEQTSLSRVLESMGSYTIQEIETQNWKGFGFLVKKTNVV